MIPASVTRLIIQMLDQIAARLLPQGKTSPHLLTGRNGEDEAYFYLRKLGYEMVARNFRSPRRKGEIDLIAWEKGILCFIEVKTRTTHDVKTAEAAVDRRKQHEIALVAREYLRHIEESCEWRFDVVSVYYDGQHSSQPRFELFRNAFSMS